MSATISDAPGLTVESIVLCDEAGRPTGTAPKLATHHADTPLHLGFSCYAFDGRGRLLVTKRAASKKVWPAVWTNSVCGHPQPGESFEEAVARRCMHEVGIGVEALRCVMPDYVYRTPPFHGIVEHEFCPVFVARAVGSPRPNPDEVDAVAWLSWEQFVARASSDDEAEPQWSWWCKDQLRTLVTLL